MSDFSDADIYNAPLPAQRSETHPFHVTSAPLTEEELKRLDNIAWTMENLLPLPGTSVRIGLDSFLGLVPVIGDLCTLVPAAYIIRAAARAGVSRRVLIRMCLNVGVDLVVGVVPVVGDIFDATWNASTRNMQLLRVWLQQNQ